MNSVFNKIKTSFQEKIQTKKTQESYYISRKEAAFALSWAVFCLLNNIQVHPSNFTIQHSGTLNVNYKILFDFINHPATVERWFQWVSHFKSADQKPLGMGKQYRAYFYIPYIGYERVDFQITKYQADSHIFLESSDVLEPQVEASVVPEGSDHTKLTIKITFGQGSLLYQCQVGRQYSVKLMSPVWLRQSEYLFELPKLMTVGSYFRFLGRKHLEEALSLLDTIFADESSLL